MKLSSKSNLEVASILGNSPDHLFFRCFPFDGMEADMDETIIIELKDGQCVATHLIREECSSMLIRQGEPLCLGCFGNLHMREQDSFRALDFELDSARYLVAVYEFHNRIYTVGQDSAALRLEKSGWIDLLKVDVDCDFYAMAVDPSGGLYVAGSSGQLYRSIGDTTERIELPTNADLFGIAITIDGELYVCGERGCVFVGNGDQFRVSPCSGCETGHPSPPFARAQGERGTGMSLFASRARRHSDSW
ncbi:MAG: hypothetical protein, partial [Olavius algarvensis Gamma 1 endosymbiont]